MIVKEPNKDAARLFAEYAANIRYEEIPPEVTEYTKKCILDMLGVILAGTRHAREEGYDKLLDLITEGGGKPESTILGFGYKVPSWMAAWANGALSRVLHYDDTYDEAVTHASCTSIPAALAVAERVGRIDGKTFITAVTIGNDITGRMGLAICQRPNGWKPDWYQTTLHGVFGAAAACGKILRLNPEAMQNALGIALYEAAGTLEGPGIASNFTAKGAVLSALMAEKGIRGARETLEGKAGLYTVCYGGDYNRHILIDQLGSHFESQGTSLKPWPGLRYFHPYIDATLQLVRKYRITPDRINEIVIYVAGYTESCCENMEMRRRPRSLLQAVTSLPFQVAVAAAKGRVRIDDVHGAGLDDPVSLRLAQMIVPRHDDRFSIKNEIGPAKVDIRLASGEAYTQEVSVAYGHPQNPMSEKDFLAKFRDCASQSVKPPTGDRIERIIDAVYRLEQVGDMAEVVGMLQ